MNMTTKLRTRAASSSWPPMKSRQDDGVLPDVSERAPDPYSTMFQAMNQTGRRTAFRHRTAELENLRAPGRGDVVGQQSLPPDLGGLLNSPDFGLPHAGRNIIVTPGLLGATSNRG
jgi:hypothetical protein